MSDDAAVESAPDREGRVGLLEASALYIAAVLGTGILVLPALTASIAGPASVLAVIAVLFLSIPLAGTFAALAARFPDAGGVTTFVRKGLGSTAARMTGYWFFFGGCVGAPVVAYLGASHIVTIFGGAPWITTLVTFLILIPPFVSNAYGVRISGSLQLILTAALAVVMVGVIAVAAPSAEAANFRPFMPNGWSSVGTSISLFVWAFAGWEAVTHIAGEFKNPRRTIPLATGIAIAAVGIAYLALQVITIAVLGTKAGDRPTPLADLVAAAAPGVGPILVAGIAAVIAMGVLNAYIGAFAKLGASLGRDGDLPRWFEKGAESGEVPRRSLLLLGALVASYFAALLARDMELTPFILIYTSCVVAVYALGMVAAVRLLATWSLGWWLGLISCALVAGLVLLAGSGLAIPGALAVAAIVVGAVKRRAAGHVTS